MDQEQSIESNTPLATGPQPATEKTIKVRYLVAFLIAVALAAGGYFLRGWFIAATVDGSPISRLSVIREAEKQTGKGVLDYMILKKLVEAEVKAKGITVSEDEITGEIQKLEGSLTVQGQTLPEFLESQGLTEKQLREQIVLQKSAEKLVAGNVAVSDADIEAYIKNNGISVPAESDKKEAQRQEIKDLLIAEKQNAAIQAFVVELRNKAAIRYFVAY